VCLFNGPLLSKRTALEKLKWHGSIPCEFQSVVDKLIYTSLQWMWAECVYNQKSLRTLKGAFKFTGSSLNITRIECYQKYANKSKYF
jgi:hypothetical protein